MSCPAMVALWCFVVFIFTTMLVYTVFSIYIYEREQNFFNTYTLNFALFCESLPPISYKGTPYIPFKNGVYEQNLAIYLSSLCFNVSHSNCINVSDLPIPPGFTNKLRVTGINPVDNKEYMFFYIFWNESTNMAAFISTGTEFLSLWKLDLEFGQIAPTILNGYREGVLIHKGFYAAYLSVRNTLWTWWNMNKQWVRTLLVSGHSLGASLSSIAQFDFADVFLETGQGENSITGPTILANLPILYTFACPKIGNNEFVKVFTERAPNAIRVYNVNDILIALPPSSINGNIYSQTENGVPFNVSLGQGPVADHTIPYQGNYLPKCAEVNSCHISCCT